MKTFQITVLTETDYDKVRQILQDLELQKLIEFKETAHAAAAPSDEQIDEIIDESELGPYYSEEEAKSILHL